MKKQDTQLSLKFKQYFYYKYVLCNIFIYKYMYYLYKIYNTTY